MAEQECCVIFAALSADAVVNALQQAEPACTFALSAALFADAQGDALRMAVSA